MAEWWELGPGDVAAAPAAPPAPAANQGDWWNIGPPAAPAGGSAPAGGPVTADEGGIWSGIKRLAEVAGGGVLRGMMTPTPVIPSGQSPGMTDADYQAQVMAAASGGFPAGLPPVSSPFLERAAPKTEGEKALANVASAVTGAAPYAIGGGVPAAARLATQAVGGGLGSTLGEELYPNHPVLGSIGGALLGGGTAGGLYGTLGRAATAAAPGLVPPVTTPISEAMTASGITPRLAGDVTQSPILQRAQQTVGRMPGGGQVSEAAERTAAEFNDQVNRTATLLTPGAAPPASVQEAGNLVQGGADRWIKNAKDAEDQAWDKVRFGDAPVDMSKPLQVLQQARDMMPGAPALAEVETPAYFQTRLDALKKDLGSGTTLPWDAAKYWRSQVGDTVGSASLGGTDATKAQVKRLYGALSDAMDDAAAGQSPEALADYTRAKAITAERHDYTDQVLSRVINPDNPMAKQPGPVANQLLTGGRAGDAMLAQLRNGMPGGELGGIPDAVDGLAAYKLRDLAAPIPSRQVPGRNVASTESYLTGLQQLSPEARETLFGGNPEVARNVNNLETVATGMRRTAQFLPNPSGTTAGSSHTGLLTSLAAELAAGFASGHPGIGAGTAATQVGAPWTLAQLLARPAGTRFLLGPQGAASVPSPFRAGALASYLARPGGP